MSWPIDIPQPPALPFLGNALDLDPEVSLNSFIKFGDDYGEIYTLRFPAGKRTFVCSAALMAEMSDESRFRKVVAGALEEMRAGVGTGLFTAHHGEKDWGVAHRILMPAFGTRAIDELFGDMYDIASQMVLKWARYGPGYSISSDDFVRVALDTIALCAMDFRFNSYHKDDQLHPFVNAMSNFMTESGNKATRLRIIKPFARKANARYQEDIKIMNRLADEIVATRKAHPTKKKDLLNAMLNGKDPQTGEKLDDELIANNLKTFLIAGHETSAGLLSFVFYNLLKSKHTYIEAQREVDQVIGNTPITAEHLPKLKYINAVLRETLRLHPAATLFSVIPHPDLEENPPTLGKGQYRLEKGVPLVALLSKIHRDLLVYGLDADEFKPDRMMDENFAKLPKGAWKPFGNGERSCIGRPFAWQEALLSVAIMLQNFEFEMTDPAYDLKLKQTLTIKPKDFFMHAKLRGGLSPAALGRRLAGVDNKNCTKAPDIIITYSSEFGHCKGFAYRLAHNAPQHGYTPAVGSIDSIANKTRDIPVIFIASAGSQLPNNSDGFLEWLQNRAPKGLSEMQYAVFGCDGPDSHLQDVPRKLDYLLSTHGARRLTNLALADGDTSSAFEAWETSELWPSMRKSFGTRHALASAVNGLKVEACTAISAHAQTCTAVVERIDALEEGVELLELSLPNGTSYQAGDHICFLPQNSDEDVKKALKRFNLGRGSIVKISSEVPSLLPTDRPVFVHQLFSACVDLTRPATKQALLSLLPYAAGPDISRLFSTATEPPTLLSLLLRHSRIPYPLWQFLIHLPVLIPTTNHPITSSPLQNPSVVKCIIPTTTLTPTAPPHVDIWLIPAPRNFQLPSKTLEETSLIFIGASSTTFVSFMADITLRSPPPKNLVSLVLSSDMQAEKEQSQVQLPPYAWLLDDEEDNRELLLEMSRENGALWYIKGSAKLVNTARDLCKCIFEQGNEGGDFKRWYADSVSEWIVDE